MNQENIFSFESLYRAYLDARTCKRFRGDILEFGFSAEENILALQKELLSGAYRHGGYRSFILTDSKKRTIEVAPFRDRVVHHAVVDVIEPDFERAFIFDSYACRTGKGTHAALRRTRSFIRRVSLNFSRPAYMIQCDIAKYFNSVDHTILFSLIEKKIKDESILRIILEIIRSTPGGRGIPIGNLTSQLFANIYLNELDHFVKNRLGVRFYVRYMDDFLLFHESPRVLVVWKADIQKFLADRLLLTLHRKRNGIQPVDRVDFLGYVLFPHHTLLRKSSVMRITQKMKRGNYSLDSVATWNGYMKHANTFFLGKKLEKMISGKG
jgi:retron-type reverse transcriptase